VEFWRTSSAVILLSTGAGILSFAIILWTSPFISILLAVVAAISWCVWLERHPLP
jgi:hypothetical protein